MTMDKSVPITSAFCVVTLLASPATTHSADVGEGSSPGLLFYRAENQGAVGVARKTRTVDARPAAVGEVVITRIAGEGVETVSTPAKAGDMVVRNRCPATGNEQYLVKANTFRKRYGRPIGPADADGWRPFRPIGKDMLFILVSREDGTFSFTAPWGEAMIARPGDALVRDPADATNTYRVALEAFACTYEIVRPARAP
jgi:hypothetical protein